VVIVGGGGAGIVAAIEAANGGASVLVLEKAEVVGGTTSLSGAIIQAAGTEAQKAWGVLGDTPERHYEYWITASEGQADPALVKVLADNAPKNIEWLIEQGLEYHSLGGVAPIPYIDPSLMVDRIHTPGPAGAQAAVGNGGPNHVQPLYKVAQGKGAKFLLETPATALVRHPEKGVVGVKAESDGKVIYVKANKAVILATSSFDHNEEMARAFSLQQLWAIQTGLVASAPTDTGDGIKMAMEIGADLAGMGGTIGYPMPAIGSAAAGIWVNSNGQRFVNESGHYAFRSRAVFNQVLHVAWAVFDDKARETSAAALGWSADLKTEIASGAVKTGETLAKLAEVLGVNATQLEETVAKWNKDVAAGKDTLYANAVLGAVSKGPYYAAKVFEWNLGSHGGVKVNTSTQVIDVDGEVIPRLYAGGMVAGGFVGPYYPGSGTAVAITVCSGRIAGQNAAKEKAWA
jgi:fumarate reductase flavoprotein subunit